MPRRQQPYPTRFATCYLHGYAKCTIKFLSSSNVSFAAVFEMFGNDISARVVSTSTYRKTKKRCAHTCAQARTRMGVGRLACGKTPKTPTPTHALSGAQTRAALLRAHTVPAERGVPHGSSGSASSANSSAISTSCAHQRVNLRVPFRAQADQLAVWATQLRAWATQSRLQTDQ